MPIVEQQILLYYRQIHTNDVLVSVYLAGHDNMAFYFSPL